MRLRLLALTLAALLPASVAAQTMLNKCIDAQGRVTYSNLPCPKTKTTQKIEIDPAPPAPPPKPAASPKPATKTKAAPAETPPQLELETQQIPARPAPRASARQCETLTEKLGKVLDRMDQARRRGYTQEEMSRWNEEARELERRKQQSGCF